MREDIHIHIDKAGGAKSSRPKLDLIMQVLREGDTLKVGSPGGVSCG
ncbi:hypothetical protein [Streptomyces sp. NPDC004008]